MSRVCITGSADGHRKVAVQLLSEQGESCRATCLKLGWRKGSFNNEL
jgi:hypothetical protein